VIQAAGVRGEVEPMTLRVALVRDLQGAAQFIPSGDMGAVAGGGRARRWHF
jgi:hypothetical protein